MHTTRVQQQYRVLIRSIGGRSVGRSVSMHFSVLSEKHIGQFNKRNSLFTHPFVNKLEIGPERTLLDRLGTRYTVHAALHTPLCLHTTF